MKKTVKLILLVFAIALIAVSTMALISCDFSDDPTKENFECPGHELIVMYSEATCTSGGNVQYTCKYCPYSEIKYEEALGHDIEEREDTPATCYQSGWKAEKYCLRCMQTIEYGYEIPAAHTEVIVEGTPATCTKSGLTEGKKCSVCNYVIVEQEKIPAGHVKVVVEATPATCTESGLTEGKICSVCNFIFVKQETIPAGHTLVTYPGYAKTCTTDGLTDKIECSVCQEILQDATVIPAGHTETVVPGYAKTCTTDGLTDGKICTVCNTVTVSQETIPAGHTLVTTKGYAATCTNNGLTDGTVCSVCDKIFATQNTIISIGHVFGEDGCCDSCSLKVSVGLQIESTNASSGSAYMVTGMGNCTDTRVIIPDYYIDGPVVAIAEGAFENAREILSVVIPATIVEVGDNAFNGCTSLENIECSDLSQVDNWSESWYGDVSEIKITAPMYGAKTPYEIFVEAMSSVSHGIERYIMENKQYTFERIDGVISETPLLFTQNIQKTYYNNYHVYMREIDYVSNYETVNEYYYLDEYYYVPSNGSGYYDAKLYMSLEFWYGEMLLDSADLPEFTEEYFKFVVFSKSIDGKMYLTLTMDAEMMLKLIEDILGTSLGQINLSDVIYKYEFDANGVLSFYTCDLGIDFGNFTDEYGNVHSYEYVSRAEVSFREVGTYNGFTIPNAENYIDSTRSCYNGNHVSIVTVDAVEPSCYRYGRNSFSYCKNCYCEITDMEIYPARHDFSNGECVDCGAFESDLTSTGLAYVLSEAESGYIVVGFGGNNDTTVYVPKYIYGLPVVMVASDAFEGSNAHTIVINGVNYDIDEFNGWQLSN